MFADYRCKACSHELRVNPVEGTPEPTIKAPCCGTCQKELPGILDFPTKTFELSGTGEPE